MGVAASLDGDVVCGGGGIGLSKKRYAQQRTRTLSSVVLSVVVCHQVVGCRIGSKPRLVLVLAAQRPSCRDSCGTSTSPHARLHHQDDPSTSLHSSQPQQPRRYFLLRALLLTLNPESWIFPLEMSSSVFPAFGSSRPATISPRTRDRQARGKDVYYQSEDGTDNEMDDGVDEAMILGEG